MGNEDTDTRAQDYVLGLMGDDERRRAERDLIADPEFRERVLGLAERLRTINREKASPFTDDAWADISQRLASLPQMNGTSSTRANSGVPTKMLRAPVKPVGRGVHELGGLRGGLVALALATAFLLGYLAGRLAWF